MTDGNTAASKTLSDVRPEMVRIMKHLEDNHTDREFLLKGTRDAVRLCSRAIISTHNGDVANGTTKLKEARRMLKEYKPRAAGELKMHITIVEQEITEASCLIAVTQGKKIPTARSLGVSDAPYLLGLLDAIGELKRMTLDMIRGDRRDEALRIFDITVEMYDELAGFAVFGNSVREIRKKIDSARITIDGMREAVSACKV